MKPAHNLYEATVHRRLFLLIMSVLLVGCGDAFSPENVAGVYDLQSINGETLPVADTGGGQGVAITGGVLTLRAEATFVLTLTLETTDAVAVTTETETASGRFTTVEPSSITLTDLEGESLTGRVDGVALTITQQEVSFRFEKRASSGGSGVY